MFLTVHSATGALLGEAVGNPILGYVLGLCSHFLLDRIPHFDPSGSEEFNATPIRLGRAGKKYLLIVCIDSALWVSFLLFLLSKNFAHPIGIAFGVLGSVTPDYIMGIYKLTKNKYLGYFESFHFWMHFDPKKIPVNILTGGATQVAALVVANYLLFR